MTAGVILTGFALFPPWQGYVIYDKVFPHPVATQFIGWKFILSQPRHTGLHGAYAEISSGILLVQIVLLAGLTTVAIALTSAKDEVPSRG